MSLSRNLPTCNTACAHTLVIGGTGMLAGAAQYLAQYTNVMTVVARTPASLARLQSLLQDCASALNLVAQDYNDSAGFCKVIADAVRLHGVPERVLVWVHNDAPARELAEQLAACGKRFSFFHVLGSASASPAGNLLAQRSAFDRHPLLAYHQIILGFVPEGSGSRWLHNGEISAGTIAAITAGLPTYVVGVVQPWSARPSLGAA